MRYQDFLAEGILFEYDRNITAKNYGDKLLLVALKDAWFVQQYNNALPGGNIKEVAKKNPEQVLDYLLTWIERGDPTRNKEYSQSIAKLYANGQSKLEDVASTLADYLAKFDKLKRKKKIQPPRNDFNRYKNLEDFYDVVDEYPDEEVEDKPEEKKNAQELYRDSKLIVTVPQDVEAACYYGQGTRWCTAGKNNNMYDYYTRGNKPLYIIIPRQPAYPNEKYQFHFETKQFMNEQDRQIGEEGMRKLVARFPVLTKILQLPAEKFNIEPLIGEEYKQIVRDATPEIQKAIAQLVEQYLDRIVAFGFKGLQEYGIRLPENVQQQVAVDVTEYIKTCMNNLDSFWEKLQSRPGSERSEDGVETMLGTDPKLTKIVKNSAARATVLDAVQATAQNMHKDAVPVIIDLVLRDPLFRFLMRQIPKMYTAKLQEQGHALS